MKLQHLLLAASLSVLAFAQEAVPVRPKTGVPPIMKVSEVKPGMKGYAWTVFEGTEPEPVPIEIVGLMKNAWGPRQDVILAKMTGRALRTNVAGGMSGSPVYIDGKLVGAVSLRISVFSPDAICGITPIELMLEMNDFDQSRPSDALVPGGSGRRASLDLPGGVVPSAAGLTLVPIETPLTFSGFQASTLQELSPWFRQLGITMAQGGAMGAATGTGLATGWQTALQPGEMAAPVLVSGDMNVGTMCTVTYNDGKRILACGHQVLNLGPVNVPMAKGEILMTLASTYQPTKIGNATGVVGAFRQDRHSAISGTLGETAEMIPSRIKVRTFDSANKVMKEKDLQLQVFVHQKWTPYLMMATLFNAINGLNEFTDDSTYRLSGSIELQGQPKLSLSNIIAPSETPMPAPMMLASWYGDKFSRLFLNSIQMPRLKSVDVTVDLLPERRMAAIESAWAESSEVAAGSQVNVKVFLRPYRGERIEKQVTVTIPPGFPRGEHRILVSDADTLNRMQTTAGLMSRFMDLPQTVSLLNQERTNNKLYISLVQSRPTVYYEDKAMPSLPASIANVMQTGRTGNRALFTAPETAEEQQAVPFDLMVTGSSALRIKVN